MAVCILQVCTLDIHGSQEVHSVAFSWDGKRVVSGGGDAVIKIWDVEMGAVVLSLSLSLLHSLSISLSLRCRLQKRFFLVPLTGHTRG